MDIEPIGGLTWRAYTYVKMEPKGTRKEMVIIISPLGHNIERALHEIGLNLVLRSKYRTVYMTGLSQRELMEALTQEMLTPYGMYLLRPNEKAVKLEGTPPIIGAFEAENWQKINKNQTLFKQSMRDYVERFAQRLEREKAKNHPVISTWSSAMICKCAAVWAGDFVEEHGTDRHSPKFDLFFQGRLEDAKPVVQNTPASASEPVA